MNPRVNVILKLHRDLYQFNPTENGGRFKNSDNVIAESIDGKERIRFESLSSFSTFFASTPSMMGTEEYQD